MKTIYESLDFIVKADEYVDGFHEYVGDLLNYM